MLYLVRHAKAGSRHEWEGDDHERPLSKAGWHQAEQVAERLAEHPVTALVSSPYVRCVQTLEPLAKLTGLTVTVDERLTEGQGFPGAIELLTELADGAVLCSHGDVIPETIDALIRRGCEIRGAADWRKASVWRIRRSKRGNFSHASVWPPPS